MPYEKVGNREPVCIADEVPFEIPNSWEWVRISTISTVVTKGTTPRGGNVAYEDKGIGFLRAENVAGMDKLNMNNLNHINEDTHFGYLKRSILFANDILITIAGTLGRTAIVRETDLPLNANQAISIIRLVDPRQFNLMYFVYALNSPSIQKALTAQKKITAIPNLTLEIISDCLLPVPPFEEQKRIVYEFQKYTSLLEAYNKRETELSQLNEFFPDQLKKSILQLAVQGKLVPQDPNDEPASVLLERIHTEKEQLIKAGKIKRDKHESVIYRRDNSHYEKRGTAETCIDAEIPFELPESWSWVRLGTLLTNTEAGKSPQCENRPRKNNEWGVIKTTAVQDGFFLPDENKVLPDGFEIMDSHIVHQDDLLITRAGPRNRTGIMCVVDSYPTNLILSDKTVRLSYLPNLVNPHYLRIALSSPAIQVFVIAAMTGMAASQVNISQEKMKTFLVPLPPFAEQERIYRFASKLLDKIDQLAD